MTLITAIVPTIDGREHWLRKCVAAYEATTASLQLVVVDGMETCGDAWRIGCESAKGDYIHFGADDVEVHNGWWQAAAACCDRGFVPAPLILHSDGKVQSCGGSWERMEPDDSPTEFTRGPFMSREQLKLIGPVPSLHYYSDNWFTWKAAEVGFPTRTCHGYLMTHHLASEGRHHNRTGDDHAEFVRLVKEGV